MITLVNFLSNIFLGSVYLSPLLTIYTPPHWSTLPDLANLTMDQRREQYRTDWSRVLELLEAGQTLLPFSDWEVVECEVGWEYNLSVTVEQDWVSLSLSSSPAPSPA